MKNRKAFLINLLLITSIVVSGCSFSNPKRDVHKEEISLKVLYYNADSFQFEYGMLLASLYPHIDFDVIGTNTLYTDHDSEEEFDYEAALYNLIE